MTQILTNAANNCIILTLNNTLSSDVNVISMTPGESLLYDSIAITDETDPNYNVLLLQDYIDSGVLIESTLTSDHSSQLQLLSQANFTIKLSNGVPEMVAKCSRVNVDNLQILPVSDKDGNIVCIYYKSIQGMSISTDLGATQTLISNDNLLFPDEITSFAVQIYDSYNGILQIVNRLYIGTLREGVKTFTPNIDVSYVNYDSNVKFSDTQPLFKNCIKQTQRVIQTGLVSGDTDTTTVSVVYPNYCATFILGIINNPYNCGSPIFIASRPQHSETNTTTTIGYTNGLITSGPTVVNNITPIVNEYKTKVAFKYLNQTIYQNNLLVNSIPTPLSYFNTSNNWVLLQENGSTSIDLINIINTITFQNDILDVITEYTPTGLLLLTRNSSGTNNLYQITCSLNLTNIPAIAEPIALPVSLQTVKIKSMSYMIESNSTNFDIFITTDISVWRYSSVSNAWLIFIHKDAASQRLNGTIDSQYLDTSETQGILTWNGLGYLQELTSFVLLPKVNTLTEYIGFLGSELGILYFTLTLASNTNTFTTNYKNGRTLLYNVAKSVISDIKLVNSYAFVCSYGTQIPRSYSGDTNCLQLIENSNSLVNQVIYLKPDVELITDSPYYVSQNTLAINSVFSGEQKSFSPVLIDTIYTYNLISPEYTFKMNTLLEDSILSTALCSFLSYKYYYPTIIERLISSVSILEPAVQQLDEYRHLVKINNINSISTSVDTGQATFVEEQISVILPIFVDNNHTKNSIVCISFDGRTIVPINIEQILVKKYTPTPTELAGDSNYYADTGYINDQYQTILTFSEIFTGTIFVQLNISEATLAFSGLYTILNHGLNKYPQVLLDSSVIGNLNDIKYIDSGRLEISFSSSVNTSITLR